MHQGQQVEVEFFRGAAVQLVWDITQEVVEGRLQLGGSAGPTVHISNLCHEMGHFVEIDVPRCSTPGWGLKLPEVFIYNHVSVVPETNQATRRECRVAAYQLNLMQHLGLPGTPDQLVSSFHFLPDWCFVPGRDDDARLRWCARRVTELSRKPKYQVAAFRKEWWRKNEILARRYRRLSKNPQMEL